MIDFKVKIRRKEAANNLNLLLNRSLYDLKTVPSIKHYDK